MGSMATTLADIKTADWSVKLGSLGEVVEGIRDIEQCLAVILTTPRGSDVLRPTFGSDLWRYIDNPISVAIPAIVREVTASITMWEPRIKLLRAQVSPAGESAAQPGAQMTVALTWQLKLAGASSRTTSIVIAGAA